MRREYVKPTVIGEMFTANEYCSSCGESGTIYKFECTAGIKDYGTRSDGHGWHGRIFQETNGVPGLQQDSKWVSTGWGSGYYEYRADDNLGGYAACNKKHEAAAADGFVDGYYVPNTNAYGNGSYQYEKALAVKIWRGDGDLHATEALDMSTWETAKS